MQVQVATFLAKEELSWSIAGNSQGTNPNIYSELIWQDNYTCGLQAQALLKIQKYWMFRVSGTQGVVISGKVTDTDYAQDDRKDPVFYTQESASEGKMQSFSAHFGRQLKFNKYWFTSGCFGYGFSKRAWYLLNPAQGLKSNYQNSWTGFSAELQLGFRPDPKWEIQVNWSYQQLAYQATADWNLIEDFQHPVSFRHRAKGYGITTRLQYNYQLNTRFSLFGSGLWEKKQTGYGTDQLYKADGSTLYTRLNGANQQAIRVVFGIQYLISKTSLND